MTCNRCEGKGVLIVKMGAPDPTRNTHARYTGAWHTFPPIKCPVCRGSGERRERTNRSAGWTLVFNADGWVTSKKRLSSIEDVNQGEMRWTPNGKHQR